MITTAFIKIWGQTVGAAAWNPDTGVTTFEYDSPFLQFNWDLSPLKMPINTGRRIFSFPELKRSAPDELDTFKGLPGLLADTLPDRYGNTLINTWLVKNGRPAGSMNPVEKLCFIGTRGIGALEFEPARFTSDNNPFNVEIDSLVDIARQLLSERKSFKTNISGGEKKAMKDILRIGTSAGGAKPKAIIAYNKMTGEIRSGQTTAPNGFEHWLIKLDGVSDTPFGVSLGYGQVEMAYYLMARDCGIEMAESQLFEENDRAHFMTKRFDREGAQTKHHIQTFCALQHYDFNDVFSYSYEQLFQTMRLLRLPYPEAEQMYRRMVFNVLAQNCDDHTKNFAFRLRKDRSWELTPAYDICHAYRPDSPWVSQHALSINGKRRNISKDDLLNVAKSINIKKAAKIVTEIQNTIKTWNSYAEEAGVDPLLRDKIESTLVVDR